MAEEKETSGPALIAGLGGGLLGATITALLMAKPAAAAPPEDKLDYILECLTLLVPALAEVAESNIQLNASLQQWLAAQGVEPGIEVSIKTAWKAKEPEEIYSESIRSVGTFDSYVMVPWIEGKRILLKVESSLDQAVNVQVLGNHVDNFNTAVNINAVVPCAANTNISTGLAWDDWHPFIGVRLTTAIAPTAGILSIWAVVQE
ncbi:hypothetical protein ES705_48497 [subsurface metagenome]